MPTDRGAWGYVLRMGGEVRNCTVYRQVYVQAASMEARTSGAPSEGRVAVHMDNSWTGSLRSDRSGPRSCCNYQQARSLRSRCSTAVKYSHLPNRSRLQM